MKKILLSTFLILFSISSAYANTQFCEGFKAGYSTGYKQKKNKKKRYLSRDKIFLNNCI